MRPKNTVFILSVLILTCGSAHARIQTVNSQGQDVSRQETAQSTSQDIQKQASQWGLNAEDYQRYQQLMDGPRGMQSPGLDPLTALGIEARTDTERKKYAEQWVRQEFARTEKELKFQREVDAAWQRLGVLSVNMGNAAGIAHDTGGRLALFVKAKDCVPCDARLAAVLADNRPVDIYLVDSHGNDSLLRDWAREHHIPVDKVRARQITLNHDGGRWMKFGNGLMPVVLQQGENGWTIAAF
ncbi:MULTISPECIES: TIGR03759 family integrating conjugative element protein [Brenneria]|uniref:TIGR03759 family integrating conjugative element protein n=1 Tax=Brenneria nigrifluens DSM 30175 = ATCC 13028 TaxID=1121120 RepID=A0A2U1UH88_9GAMM|nr:MULTISPECIES: TIGR03759 family integrating conjugative element protein [Brenneria]EHD22957.1 integrating conjugative element protein, PFL_4693 family [Brenneria sp. EniD312]MCG8708824.1 TIGR03759 family integrating conjugative element protein [Brenneria bubanii]PWC21048.1 TIGR03759 family integrating conjugative element protein [Brenneria nigrifluens DSM 30175 = ATCC 13028]QCR06151.1 TIGR03759 family integrating conjugative element protein [Brenneria nigrifluens DSM 30175 = ATCC 13028]